MNDKPIYRIASLVMALVMILGTTIHTQAAPVAQTTGPSIYWGAIVNGQAPSPGNLAPGGVFDVFETRSRKKMSILHWGLPWMLRDGSWGEFPTSYFEAVRNRGSIPMVNWNSFRLGAGVNQPDFQLRDIYEGRYDAYIQRWATAAKNWGHPFFLYFNAEMNGWWYNWGEGKTSSGVIVNGNSAGDTVKAWQHVHDIFTSVGATNVSWVWGPNHISTSSQYPPLASVYPGDAYVDWTGLSVYNQYPTWLGLNSLLTGSGGITWLKNSYNEILAVAPNKPMMIAQWASIEAGDGGAKKAAWITDALTTQIPLNFPKIKAVVWFNWQENANEAFPIESSQAATNAWAAGISSPLYAANVYNNLNTSPIPAPAGASVAPTPVPATQTTTSATFIAITDTYISSATPNSTAGGTSTTLYVSTSPVQKTFLKFDLSSLAGKTISTVKLKIKTTSIVGAGSVNVSNVKLVNDVSWKEQYVSYNNPVAVSPTLLGNVPGSTVRSTWYEITLATSPIQPKVGGLLAMAIEATGSDDLRLNSREATDKPQLIVTYQ